MALNSTWFRDKKVCVTGGSGFVGRHIVRELLKQNACVRIPLHVRVRPSFSDDSTIEYVSGDLAQKDDCSKAMRGAQFVFHAAGSVAGAKVTKENPIAGIVTNLVLTGRVLEAAAAEGVERFLLFSSSTGYPDIRHPVKEDEFWSADPHASYLGYGWMRRYFERLAEFIYAKTAMKIAVVRPSAVYGRHDNFDPATGHVVSGLIHKAVMKQDPFEVWGTGNEARDFLHITDFASACCLMLEKKADCDPVNIGYGKALTIKQCAETVLTAAGHSPKRILFDDSKPTVLPFRMMDVAKARVALGFSPRMSFEEGILDTVNWYKKHLKIQ